MFEKRYSIQVPLPVEDVFDYLRSRYDSRDYREASAATKGYVPRIECVDEEENRRVEFKVPGRDPFLHICIAGWRWGYRFYPLTSSETQVEIWYRWGLWQAVLGAGTIGHQAANEITEAVLALDALSRK